MSNKSKFNNIYKKLQAIYNELDNLIGEIEEKQNLIEEKAIDDDREMTKKEYERYDEYEEQILDIRECIDNLECAMYNIENYTA